MGNIKGYKDFFEAANAKVSNTSRVETALEWLLNGKLKYKKEEKISEPIRWQDEDTEKDETLWATYKEDDVEKSIHIKLDWDYVVKRAKSNVDEDEAFVDDIRIVEIDYLANDGKPMEFEMTPKIEYMSMLFVEENLPAIEGGTKKYESKKVALKRKAGL